MYDYYKIMRLPMFAPRSDIEYAYAVLMKRTENENEKVLIQAAYEYLSQNKEIYDCQLMLETPVSVYAKPKNEIAVVFKEDLKKVEQEEKPKPVLNVYKQENHYHDYRQRNEYNDRRKYEYVNRDREVDRKLESQLGKTIDKEVGFYNNFMVSFCVGILLVFFTFLLIV